MNTYINIEIIISSFNCEECGFSNNEVQFGGKIGDFGTKYTLKVECTGDLSRSVVKSEYATVKIPELDLEIPPIT
jgi:zinc finger protein